MDTKDRLLKYMKKRDFVTGRQLAEFLGVSRQAVNLHLKELIRSGEVVKGGKTRGAVYRLAQGIRDIETAGMGPLPPKFAKKYRLAGLTEHTVFKEAELLLNLKGNLKRNVYDIVQYAFTEMLNNAIEHSESEHCYVEVAVGQYNCRFRVRDYGIGIFQSISVKFGLPNEIHAIGELTKGKATTMREKHTGEGVFFTSKVADRVAFRSHKLIVVFDNKGQGISTGQRKFIEGTDVEFSISTHSKRKRNEIFDQFIPEKYDYGFDRTKIPVRLFSTECISRSQARRLLSGLHRFKEVILDFKGVDSIGQGFADEVFRVFAQEHPDMVIDTENVNPALQPIIRHALDNNI